jgi:hypothetical protein
MLSHVRADVEKEFESRVAAASADIEVRLAQQRPTHTHSMLFADCFSFGRKRPMQRFRSESMSG